jgi:hypothetical protein
MEHTTSPKPELGAVFPATPCSWVEADQHRIHECCGLESIDHDADPVLLAVGGVNLIGQSLLDHLPQIGPVITRQTLTVKRLTTGRPIFWDDEISFVRVAPTDGEQVRIEVRNAAQQVSITGRVFAEQVEANG